jgi:hypothetical protein
MVTDRSRQHAEVFAADGLFRGHLPTLRSANDYSFLRTKVFTFLFSWMKASYPR